MGKNDIKRAEGITAQELAAYAEQLYKFSVEMREAEMVSRTQSNQTLYTYNLASLQQGTKRLRAFVTSLSDSRIRAVSNRPILPGDLKNERRKEEEPPAKPKKAPRKK